MFLHTLINKIFKLLNIKIQKNQGILLTCTLITGLLLTYTCSPITKEIVSNLPAQWLSFESVWYSCSAFLIGVIWKGKIRDFAIKYFVLLAAIESFAGFCTSMYLTFVHYDVWIYAIATLLYSSMVCNFVSKCVMCFESKLWHQREREDFDNTNSVVRNILCMIGFGASLIKMPSVKVSIFIWGCCCIIDDIGWITVYIKNRKRILE